MPSVEVALGFSEEEVLVDSAFNAAIHRLQISLLQVITEGRALLNHIGNV
jgi:hypothetical protein